MQTNQNSLNKVAQITLFFWIMKVLATTLGEVLGDFFSMTLNLGYIISLGITVGLFVVVLAIQLRAERLHTVLYWLVIIGTTTVGTEISDLMDRTLGLGYALGSLILFAGLLLTLFLWHRKEGKIRVYPITDTGVEAFYWIAILFSNSLGTAFGDYLSDNIGLSYGVGALVTGGIIVVVVLLHYYSSINRIFLFWVAFIFTRPFGATFGDLLTKPLDKGGLNFGRGLAALITAGLLFAVMWYSSRKQPENNWGEK
ncbi:hypothetical protein [Spirosoma spitsbergense]|jgi:uncharacterized membrane-anchored protein|uniref:COG4705 family protein n=1 Tax=Spirosoma spitsbergense TaxID=431554 RepID=UPI00035C0BC7|nr:hypothetical protein [Spirosoma spitsbergense]